MSRKTLVACALVVLLAGAAEAQNVVVGGVGPRVGFGVEPDQVVFGGQVIIGEIAPDLTFDPSLELGFGSDLTVISMNFDLHYHFNVSNSRWRPYAGGGLAVHFVQFDAPPGVPDPDDTRVDGNLVVGAGVPTASNNRFFAELKIGLGDVYDLKGMVGWNFKI